MTRERFMELADAYGSDLGRWPAAERAAAEAFLRVTPDASAILRAEADLDALMAQAVVQPSATLRERIIAMAPRPYRPVWRRGGTWISGAGLAAACVLGIMLGASVSSSYLGDPASDAISEASTAFDDTAYFDFMEAG